MRYPRSGYTDQALVAYGTAVREVLNGGITSGRVFWLRGILISNTHAANVNTVGIFDAAEAALGDFTKMRASIYCPAATTVVVDFPAPGIKFVTNVTLGTVEAISGTFAAYGLAAWGFEE